MFHSIIAFFPFIVHPFAPCKGHIFIECIIYCRLERVDLRRRIFSLTFLSSFSPLLFRYKETLMWNGFVKKRITWTVSHSNAHTYDAIEWRERNGAIQLNLQILFLDFLFLFALWLRNLNDFLIVTRSSLPLAVRTGEKKKTNPLRFYPFQINEMGRKVRQDYCAANLTQ